MMTNKLISRSCIKNHMFQSNLCASQKQPHPNQFTQNISSYFVKMNISLIDVIKVGVVN